MPLAEIKKFAELRSLGDETIDERVQMLKKHRVRVEEQINKLKYHHKKIDEKIWICKQGSGFTQFKK